MAGKTPKDAGPMDPNAPAPPAPTGTTNPVGGANPPAAAAPQPARARVAQPVPGRGFQPGSQTGGLPPGRSMGGATRMPTQPPAPTPQQPAAPAQQPAPPPETTGTTGQDADHRGQYTTMQPGTPGFMSDTGGYGGAVPVEQERKQVPPQAGKGGRQQTGQTQATTS